MYLKKETPNFIFKGQDALMDFNCMIEEELPEIAPNLRIETKVVRGRNGTLHKTYGDYDSFTFEIKSVSIPYDKLQNVKNWLRGYGKLITHNDPDKYLMAYVRYSKPIEFVNDWGVFFTFDILFECQPLRRKVRETPLNLVIGENIFINHGNEMSAPYLEIQSMGGDIEIIIENETFTLLNTRQGLITLDCELGLAIFDGSHVRTRGTWPRLASGRNALTLQGNIKKAAITLRSVWS